MIFAIVIKYLWMNGHPCTPRHPCICCHRLWFKIQTTSISKKTFEKLLVYIPDLQIGIKPILCRNYHSNLFKNRNPKFLVPNNVKLNEKMNVYKSLKN